MLWEVTGVRSTKFVKTVQVPDDTTVIPVSHMKGSNILLWSTIQQLTLAPLCPFSLSLSLPLLSLPSLSSSWISYIYSYCHIYHLFLPKLFWIVSCTWSFSFLIFLQSTLCNLAFVFTPKLFSMRALLPLNSQLSYPSHCLSGLVLWVDQCPPFPLCYNFSWIS